MKIKLGNKLVDEDVFLKSLKHSEKLCLMVSLMDCFNLAIEKEEKEMEELDNKKINEMMTEINKLLTEQLDKKVFFVYREKEYCLVRFSIEGQPTDKDRAFSVRCKCNDIDIDLEHASQETIFFNKEEILIFLTHCWKKLNDHNIYSVRVGER